MGYLEKPRAVPSINVTVTVNMLDVVYFSDGFKVMAIWTVRGTESHPMKSHTPYMNNPYIHKKIGAWCALSYRCLVPSSTRPQLTVRYKQTSHPSSSRCSKRMKSLLASSRWLHMSYLSKNNGFLKREFWEAIHFYRFVAPPCHQTGHQLLSLRPTKRPRQDKPIQADEFKANIKFLGLQMYCYVVSKNITQRVQEATFNTHCDHEKWFLSFFPFHC